MRMGRPEREGKPEAGGQEARPHGQGKRFSFGIERLVRSVAGAGETLARGRSPVERGATADQFGGAASALSSARSREDADLPARTKPRRAPLARRAVD